jgi:hypothetical protein
VSVVRVCSAPNCWDTEQRFLRYYFHLQSKEMSGSLNCITYEGYSTHMASYVVKTKREIIAPSNLAHL